jgi:hypothetical protein
MIAALGTLPFLATLWLLAVLGARILEESGAKIAAALKGEHILPKQSTMALVRMRERPLSRRVRRPELLLRAVA